jgi:hypothetical protein
MLGLGVPGHAARPRRRSDRVATSLALSVGPLARSAEVQEPGGTCGERIGEDETSPGVLYAILLRWREQPG